MDLLKELRELKDTIGHEIAQANQEIRKSGGDLNSGDIEMIDKLTHAMKSLATTCAMLEAEEEGYSGDYSPMGPYYGGNSRRYGRDTRNGYSRAGEWGDQLRQMMDEAPDEATRMEIKKLMDRMDQR